jgi:myo-inositol-1(or 4)-monophosphatase
MIGNLEIDAASRALAADALRALVEAARLGGEIALRDFRAGQTTSAEVEHKHGGSPVTAADLAVDAFLKARLGAAFPDAGWLSEETADDPGRLSRGSLLVVDPIDGTRAYVGGDPRWTVSIALVVDHRPIAGVVHAPALRETFAASLGGGTTLNGAPIHASRRGDLRGARIAGPRPLIAAVAAVAGIAFEFEPRIPSLAYRLARVASGALDAAFASRDSHDWDIAGADILLAEAGARLADADGRELRYNGATIRRGALVAAPLEFLDELVSGLRRANPGGPA